MPRPQKSRLVATRPEISHFNPQRVAARDAAIARLTLDQFEAIRLSDLLNLTYDKAGRQMGVSRATFGRIIQSARKVIADAIVNGKAISIGGGSYTFADKADSGPT
jgi:predicted DNA-binding protein (UPF0251 family)